MPRAVQAGRIVQTIEERQVPVIGTVAPDERRVGVGVADAARGAAVEDDGNVEAV